MPEKPHQNNHHYSRLDSKIQCLNEIDVDKTSKSQFLAEKTAEWLGSWKFIIIQTVLLFIWTIVNIVAWLDHWDPYPFILLNLVLALQTAYAGPLIMMSQNRQTARDRLEAHNDYLLNIKAEQEIRNLTKQLEAQSLAINKLQQLILELTKKSV